MIVDQYDVHADASAKLCLDEAIYVGKVDLASWLAQPDTVENTYCTHDVDGEVRAIRIAWHSDS